MKELLIEFFASILGESKASEEAKRMGLVHLGGGSYAKKKGDEPTHMNIDGQLRQIIPDPRKEKVPAKKTAKRPTAPKPTAEPKAKKPTRPFGEVKQVAQKVVTSLYGEKRNRPLLQDSPASDAALKNGYKEGEWWVAPGNAGSNFNENMSNEGMKILEIKPNLSEEELAMVLFLRTNGTGLGEQITANPDTRSEDKIVIPAEISPKDRALYKSCVIAARSARAKHRRVSDGVTAAQDAGVFGKRVKLHAVGGTSRKGNTPDKVVTDREKLLSAIESAPKCFIYDPETGQTYEIPKDVLVEWAKSSGGGENAADTVVFATDEKGNLLYDGWSDKISLSALQANSSLNNDMSRGLQRVDRLLERGQIGQKEAAKAKKLLADAQEEIAKTERAYKLVASNNAKYFLTKTPEELAKIEREASKEKTTAKHYAKFKQVVTVIKKGKGKSDAKSVAIAEAISGVPRKKSKEEKQAEKYVTQQLEKYEADSIKELLSNPAVPDDVKAEVKKANEVGAAGRKEYMGWFNTEWLKDKSNRDTLRAATPFTVLCRVGENVDMVSSDERKILERSAVRERQRLEGAGETIPASLKSIEELSKLRQIALNNQRQVFKSLERIPARTDSGKKTTVGALLGFEDASDALHLDKIDRPKNNRDYRQILKRSTQLVMEGIPITPKTLRECLGVKNTQELQDYFVVGFDDERFTRAKDNPNVITGKTVALYMVIKDRKVEIAPKVFRSKSGLTGKTQNTLAWSDQMQDCFDSKRGGE